MAVTESVLAGTYEGFAHVPDEVYNGDKLYFRNSWQTALMDSPAHLQAYLKRPPAPTEAMTFGRALHCRLLEPEHYESRFVQEPRFLDATGKKLHANSKEYKSRAAEFAEDAADKTILYSEDWEAIEGISEKLLSDSHIRELLKGAKTEHAMFWRDPETGVRVKAKMDIDRLDVDAILDIKKIGKKATLKHCRDAIVNFGYHRAAALYCSGATVLTSRNVRDFALIFVEDQPPYEFRIMRINDAAFEIGMAEYRRNLQTYAECLRTNQWPGYKRAIEEIDLPAWYYERAAHEII